MQNIKNDKKSKNKNFKEWLRRYKFAIIIITITFLMATYITLSILKIVRLKNDLNVSQNRVSELYNRNLEDQFKNIVLEDENKTCNENLGIYDTLNRISIEVSTRIEKLFLRYDELYITEHNWVIRNVNWDNSGIETMRWYLNQQKKIQNDYQILLDQINNLTNQNDI